MREKEKILATMTIALMLFAFFSPVSFDSLALALAEASLTGRIFDYVEDTDSDGLQNYLVVDVEVQVYEAGDYRVQISSLRDAYYNSVYFGLSAETYLDIGGYNVSLFFNGIAIYATKLNITHIVGLSLSYQRSSGQYVDIIVPEAALSRTYDFTEFDTGATLLGDIFDEGIDTDGDVFYNVLQIGVEIDVADAGFYQVRVSELVNESDSYYYHIYISNSTRSDLDIGTQVVNVTLHGAPIYASHATNISRAYEVSLYVCEDYEKVYFLDSRYYLPFSRPYSYQEFETLAYFTGAIFDEGVDSDGNGKYDYLEINVEINVGEAGNYALDVISLVDNASGYLFLYEPVSDYFDVGVHLVNFTVYGPRIYRSRFNPMYIGTMELRSWDHAVLCDSLSSVPLSQLYNYTDFESHAFFTGKISDRGVDKDGDGLFDCLEVGVEISVTEAGVYEVNVGRLWERVNDTYTKYLYISQSVEQFFEVGNHTTYFKYSGPRLAYECFSPTHVADISLHERVYPSLLLDYIPPYLLSVKYNYTLFNAPLNDMQISLVVYPNGTLGVSGTANFTHMYPENMGPLVNATVGISTVGETTTGSAGGTVVFPEDGAFGWPFDSTVASFASQYDDGLMTAQLDATMFMPPEGKTTYPTNSSDFILNGTYSDGLLDVKLWGETRLPSYFASMFPFNVTDVVVLADYAQKTINGNITFRMISGFPISDVVVYLKGDESTLNLTGNFTVLYGTYFDMEINSTIVDALLANFTRDIPGPTGLLYNVTEGLLECTQLDTLKTPLIDGGEEYGANIDYNATIQGNFTGLLTRLLTQYPGGSPETEPMVYAALDSVLSSVQEASLTLTYYYTSGIASIDLHLRSDVVALWSKALERVPPLMPIEYRAQAEAWLKIANATAHALHGLSLNASYSSATQRLDLKAWLSANVTQLKSDIIPVLPGAVPPELRDIIESYLNTTYCTLKSSTVTVSYVNGTADFDISWVAEGDFRAELNRFKRFYIDYVNATSPMALTGLIRMLDKTEIDINNFELEFRIGQDWMYVAFDGLIAQPARDDIDFIRFRLHEFFNMTSDPQESPRKFEKLKITIISGFNGTHTVLLQALDTVPIPDMTSLDYKTMVWQNVTVSSLRDLLFKIAYQGVINYIGNTYYVPIFTNSTISGFGFDAGAKSISFSVVGTAGTGFCNVTVPRSLLYAAIGDWVVKIDGITLPSENFTVAENAEYVFIYVDYAHSEHTIELVGTWVVVEYPPNLLPLILLILSAVALIIAVKQRRRLNTFKTKYQTVAQALVNRLLQGTR